MKLAVCLFVWLLHALDALNDVLRFDIFNIDLCGVTDQTENRGVYAVPAVDADAVVVLELFGKGEQLLGCGGWL